MSILDNLPHLATAKKRARMRDRVGGSDDEFPVTVFSDRACWRQRVSDGEKLEFNKRGVFVSHKVYFTTDPGVDERHILVIGGVEYDVRSAAHPDASVGLGVVYRVMVDIGTSQSKL